MQNLQNFSSFQGLGRGKAGISTSYSLSFDGTQNYVALGNLGTLGSNLGSGIYFSCRFKTSSTSPKVLLGAKNANGNNTVALFANQSHGGTTATNNLRFVVKDNLGNETDGSCTVTFTDGNPHTVICTWASPNTITISLDGAAQAVSYGTITTPSSFANFNSGFCLGAEAGATISNWYACQIAGFSIGTSPASLSATYPFREGTGTTIADSSGNSNTGTLTGSPLPTWGVKF